MYFVLFEDTKGKFREKRKWITFYRTILNFKERFSISTVHRGWSLTVRSDLHPSHKYKLPESSCFQLLCPSAPFTCLRGCPIYQSICRFINPSVYSTITLKPTHRNLTSVYVARLQQMRVLWGTLWVFKPLLIVQPGLPRVRYRSSSVFAL